MGDILANLAGSLMGNVRQGFDTSNIPGHKLAEIGKWALTGKKIVEENIREREGDYTNLGWLDMRVEEICRKGKI